LKFRDSYAAVAGYKTWLGILPMQCEETIYKVIFQLLSLRGLSL
jgi:hypothetical protein